MKLRQLLRLPLWLPGLFSAFLFAEPVAPPIARVLTDEFGRTIDARILEVTPDTIEFVREADRTRFKLPLKSLSASDQLFASDLLQKIIRERPLPDTPLVAAIRRDFRIFDPAKRVLVSVPSNAYAQTRFFVIGTHPVSELDAAVRDRRLPVKPFSEQVAILWITITGEATLFELLAERMPPGHATIAFAVQQTAIEETRPAQEAFLIARNGTGNDPFASPARPANSLQKDRELFFVKLRRILPAYWTDYSANFYTGESRGFATPRFVVLRRDGIPVKFRGAPLSGSLEVVATVLREHTPELE
jgi:hypothetical protein